MTRRVLIMGAAGRDFHNFNVVYRDDPDIEVVAFTATQIPFISDRGYPAELAGPRYPDGIPIYDESELMPLIAKLEVDDVVFAYSDVNHEYVMHKASEVLAAGANFVLLGPDDTMLEARVPVVAVCAIRTGCGKSQTTRYVADLLKARGLPVVAVRHPMPYGDLVAETRATLRDVRRPRPGPRDDRGARGVRGPRQGRHGRVRGGRLRSGPRAGPGGVRRPIWDGGNNDLPFYRPELHITVTDPLRAGHERTYHPGEANLRMADVVLINKVGGANAEQIASIERSTAELNPRATVLRADSVVELDRPEVVAGKAVLVVEDGPTLTHGGMKYGAGVVAARRAGAFEIVDPRPYVTGTIAEVFEKYDVVPVLPAEGYSDAQLGELEQAITATPCDALVIGTPMDLRHLIRLTKPVARATYRLQEPDGPGLQEALQGVIAYASSVGVG